MWFRIKPEEDQIKKTIEKIKNKKLSMGTDNTYNLPGCYNIGRIDPFWKVKIMREKLKKLKLEHLLDELKLEHLLDESELEHLLDESEDI